MGLSDLLEENGVEQEPDKYNSQSRTRSKPVKPHLRDTTPDYEVRRKACPQCAWIGESDGERSYSCINGSCDVVNFKMDWSEFRGDDTFLGSVDWFKVNKKLVDIMPELK